MPIWREIYDRNGRRIYPADTTQINGNYIDHRDEIRPGEIYLLLSERTIAGLIEVENLSRENISGPVERVIRGHPQERKRRSLPLEAFKFKGDGKLWGMWRLQKIDGKDESELEERLNVA
ncbi:MAG: hypothetical protein QW331_00510 [Candidatus Woesearchaeota archaeon]